MAQKNLVLKVFVRILNGPILRRGFASIYYYLLYRDSDHFDVLDVIIYHFLNKALKYIIFFHLVLI